MVIEAGFECAMPVFLLTPAGDSNEEDAAAPRRSPNFRRQLVAVHIWKADVEENCMRVKRLGAIKRTSAVISRPDIVA